MSFDNDQDVRSYHAAYAIGATAIQSAEVQEVLVGSIIATFDGWRANLYRVAVHPTYRRRGIARALVSAGESHLRQLGAHRAVALVVMERVESVGLWRDAGYDHDPNVGRSVKTI